MSAHATCPYRGIPDMQRWDRAFPHDRSGLLDPYVGAEPRFRFTPEHRIVTVGSCFAQHISRELRRHGYNYVMAEYDAARTPEENDAAANTMFSARYGNVYTVAHFSQLLDRAYGRWTPQEQYWEVAGRYFDPFRPSVDAEGFAALDELIAARDAHLAAVRTALETADVLVFTLGLTEGWIHKADGAAYPICPGCGFGSFDAAKYAYKNYTRAEISAQLEYVFERLSEINPALKVILTVSPVPLAATMEPRHVMLSTAASKSILRTVCEEAVQQFPNTDYFASYELINWGRDMSSYLEGDLRTVSDAGIDHVMKVFFRHYAGRVMDAAPSMTGQAWCDEDQVLGGVATQIAPAAPRPARARTGEEEQAFLQEQSGQGMIARKFEVLRQRQPHPYLTWKGAPHDTILQGRTLDANGYLNTRDIAKFMGPEFKRICVMGPSIVMDVYHDEPATICGVMERELRSSGHENVFVYNCGIQGSVSGQDLANLVHCVADFNPEVVVMLGGVNDLRSAQSGDPRIGYPQSFFLWENILKNFQIEGRPPEVTASLTGFEYNLPRLRAETGHGGSEWVAKVFEQFQQNVYKIRAICNGLGIGCVVVNAPTMGSWRTTPAHPKRIFAKDDDKMLWLHAMGRKTFIAELEALHEREVFFSRDLSALVDDMDLSVFKNYVHMQASGYERIGEAIAADVASWFQGRLSA